MKEKLLSLIIPSHGIEKKLLKENLEMIKTLLSKHNNVEAIFIDDKCPNSSFEVAKTIFGNMENVQVYKNQTNLKLMKTVLSSFKYINGKYVAQFDPDDKINTYAFQELLDYLETQDSDIIFNSWIQNGKIKKVKPSKDLINKNTRIFTPTVIYKRKIFKQIPTPKVISSYLEDKWLAIHAILLSKTVDYSNIAWYEYAGAGTSTVQQILGNIKHYNESSKEFLLIKSDLPVIIHQQLRIVVAMGLFTMITSDKSKKVVLQEIREYIKENNPELEKHIINDNLFTNVYKQTFMGGYSPFLSLILYIIKKQK